MTAPSPIRILSALALTITAAQGDTVVLKNGETVDGQITARSASSVTIEVVNASGSIREPKTFAMSEVTKVTVFGPDDFVFRDLKKLIPPQDLKSAGSYKSDIRKCKGFLRKFPASRHKAEVGKFITTLEGELAKRRTGQQKVGGNWVTEKEFEANKYKFEATAQASLFSAAAAKKDYLGAMKTFATMEKSYPLSLEFPKAIPEATKLLEKYAGKIKGELRDVGARKKQREQNLAKLTPSEKKAAENADKKRVSKLKKDQITMKAAGAALLPYDNLDQSSMQDALRTIDAEKKRHATLPVSSLKKNAEVVAKVMEALGKGEASVAKAFLAKLPSSLSDPHVSKLRADAKKLGLKKR